MGRFRIHIDREPAPKRPPQKDPEYLVWLHTLPCIVSQQSPVQAAHVNTASPRHGHDGRGKGQKAHDSFALPLHHSLHDMQHRGSEMAFWQAHYVDPHLAGLVLYGIYCRHKDNHEATARAIEWIRSGAQFNQRAKP